MSKNSPQQNIEALKDWKKSLDQKRKTQKTSRTVNKTKIKYHPALEYNEE